MDCHLPFQLPGDIPVTLEAGLTCGWTFLSVTLHRSGRISAVRIVALQAAASRGASVGDAPVCHVRVAILAGYGRHDRRVSVGIVAVLALVLLQCGMNIVTGVSLRMTADTTPVPKDTQ